MSAFVAVRCVDTGADQADLGDSAAAPIGATVGSVIGINVALEIDVCAGGNSGDF